MTGERNKLKLREEIEAMWLELDNTFNHNAIVKLEDDLKLK